MEISDARLALRAYTDATVAEQARRNGEREAYSGKELDAYVEAARIAAGVAALRTGAAVQHPDQDVPYDPPSSYDDQAAWLALVSRAYRSRLATANSEPTNSAAASPAMEPREPRPERGSRPRTRHRE